MIGMLGKHPPRYDRNTPLLANFLDPRALPPPQTNLWWGSRYQRAGIAMALNDQLGDCTIASKVHGIGLWTSDVSGHAAWVNEASVLTAYKAVSGYNGTPATDAGANMLAVAKYFRDVGIDGHKIVGYAALELSNLDLLRVGIDLFGFVDIGAALPLTAQSQPNVWTVVANAGSDADPGSWGGHDFILVGHSPQWFLGMTWNQLIWVSIPWVLRYIDEAYIYLSTDWISSQNGRAPSGLDLPALQIAMRAA